MSNKILCVRLKLSFACTCTIIILGIFGVLLQIVSFCYYRVVLIYRKHGFILIDCSFDKYEGLLISSV